MKIAILVIIYNRPNYLKQCLESIKRADLNLISEIAIADDGSTDSQTIELIEQFRIKDKRVVLTEYSQNRGIRAVLKDEYDCLIDRDFDLVINLDSDAMVRNDFVEQLVNNYIPKTLLTGFHCTTKNANGTDRHKILREQENLYFKRSVGGINFCIDKFAYENYVRPALTVNGNWDHNACITAKGAYCLKESVIQHIGFDSSMGHTEAPDVADDFKNIYLKDVTLLGVDSNSARLDKSEKICTENIKFAKVVKLNPPISSKEAYSEFIIKEAYKQINTSHCLIFQHDGVVNNWQAWNNDWLQYDYIGAPWHYSDGMAVGNGGFSLRSKKLMEICATDEKIKILHPEDHHICRTYRPYLEFRYGIKFAPLEVAERFSFEGYMQPDKFLSDQFGVHGSNPRKEPIKIRSTSNPAGKIANERYVFNQSRGLGDILFLVPLCRALMREGNTVIWPIDPEYLNIAKHFPDIDFRDMRTINVNYESRSADFTQYGRLLPYRYANELMGVGWNKMMQSKYELYGHNYLMWRELVWRRDYKKEAELAELVGAKGKYTLVNRNFANAELRLKISPVLDTTTRDMTRIEMMPIPGFSLIDWCGIIQGASEIHTANTSINYLIELMDIKVPVYMYPRNVSGEKGFEHTRELWQSKCWRFVE